MDAIRVHKFSEWEELKLWWAVQGELYHDLAMYYVICSVVGFLQGLAIGYLIRGIWL